MEILLIYKSKIGDIDLSKTTRLYPAAVIEVDGEIAEMSLEWMEMNEGKVTFKNYVLVFDFTVPSEKIRDKKEIHFDTKEELILAMTEVSQLFDS